MPHLILEHSDNVALPDPVHDLLADLHACLEQTAGVDPSGCKSRVYGSRIYFIGDGDAEMSEHGAFVHLQVSLLEGRTDEEKSVVSTACLALLKLAFLSGNADLDLQITVDVRDLNRAAYAKYVSFATAIAGASGARAPGGNDGGLPNHQ